jgi:predicted MFS family arabinose efflux permease
MSGGVHTRTASPERLVTGSESAPTASRRWSFWTIAATLTLFGVSNSAPSPLYPVYAQRFDFSATTLTAIFAVAALFLLLTLIPAGTLSDQLGRRPVILGAIAVQAAAMVLFLLADGTAMLYAARIAQGAATGAALGALSAALVDFQPVGTARGALVAGVAVPIGLALGALGSGVLVQFAAAPLRLVYWVQLAALALATLVITLFVPETITARARHVRLQIRVRVPPEARQAFAAFTPGLIATWALNGLLISLGPSLALVVLRSHSHVVGGLVPATLFFLTAFGSVATRTWDGRRAVVWGSLLGAVGVLVTLAGIRASSSVLLLCGSAIAGLGFGPAFTGTLRTLAPLAAPSARGGLFAAVYVVCYLAFGLPAVAAGLATTHWGLRDTASAYALILVLLALAAAALTARAPLASGANSQAR